MMFCFFLSLCLSKYNICFYNSDNSKCPSTSDNFSLSDWAKFLDKEFPDKSALNVYLLTDLENDFPIINKFNDFKLLSFYGIDKQYKVIFDNKNTTNIHPTIISNNIILLVNRETQFSDAEFTATIVSDRDNGQILTPLKANNIIIDTRSLINVHALHATNVELRVPYFASSLQTFYIHGNGSLNITQIFDKPLLSFYGDSLVVSAEGKRLYINTAYWYGTFSVHQQNNTYISLQYLMANMTLKDRVIHYELGANSVVNFAECIWPSIDRTRVELTRTGNATIILSAYNIPLFIKGHSSELTILTNSTELAIPGLDITNRRTIAIGSVPDFPNSTVFTIGMIYCQTSESQITTTDPRMTIVAHINTSEESGSASFEDVNGQAQWSLLQFPPVSMEITVGILSSIHGNDKLAIPLDVESRSGRINVNNYVNGSIQIFPNIVGNPTIEKIKEHHDEEVVLFSCASGLDNVTLYFNSRGLRGFTEGTNIYDKADSGNPNELVIKQTRNIDEVNDHFCIAENSSICPEGSTFIIDDNWVNFADHEIAEMTFYVYESNSNILLDFSKFDKPVVNFIGIESSSESENDDSNSSISSLLTINITGNSIEYNISYLVAKNIYFNIIGGPEIMTLGYSADLTNTKFNVPFEFVDSETYNFNSDYESLPKDNITSHLAEISNLKCDNITLNSDSIVFTGVDIDDHYIYYDPDISTNFRFVFTSESQGRTININKGNGTITYQIEIAAETNSAIFNINIGDHSDFPIIKFTSFGSECTINSEYPPVMFNDLIDGSKITLTQLTTYFDFTFDASSDVVLMNPNPNSKVIFSDIILPNYLVWKTTNIDVIIRNGHAVGGPSHYDNITIDNQLVFNEGPSLSINNLNTYPNATLIIPYSFNSMPQINFTSSSNISISKLIMQFTPPIDENVFVHRNIQLYEDSEFDVLCGHFDCEKVDMVYESEIKYFNGSLSAFVKYCVPSPHGQCLRIWFDSERDPIDDDDADNKHKTKIANIVIGVISAIVALTLIIIIVVFLYKRRAKQFPERLNQNLLDNQLISPPKLV